MYRSSLDLEFGRAIGESLAKNNFILNDLLEMRKKETFVKEKRSI
jgi:hypothetical protein